MVTTLVGILAPLLLSGLGYLFKAKQDQATSYFKLSVSLAAKVAASIAPHTQNTVDDKIAAFLEVLAGEYEDHGKVLTVADAAKAKTLFLQMNGVK